ncbi:MAG: hypothetical protein ACXWMJ_06525, partial [Syntrophales bacterium]
DTYRWRFNLHYWLRRLSYKKLEIKDASIDLTDNKLIWFIIWKRHGQMALTFLFTNVTITIWKVEWTN